ncbi:MAG: hypothetical protein R2819_11070 [Allomuricauda sp.]
MDRKTFLKGNLSLGSVALVSPSLLMANPSTQQEELLEKELIMDFVSAAHRNLEETRQLLEKYPLLLNCNYQWKKGDFETAMGGASHVGRKDVAEYLIGKGARMDIFNYAFLGYDGFIKKIISDHPQLLHSYGPHGFTLLHHAEVGERKELAQWLRDQGLSEKIFKGLFG